MQRSSKAHKRRALSYRLASTKWHKHIAIRVREFFKSALFRRVKFIIDPDMCLDEKDPKMAPDVINGIHRTWKEEYLVLEYNRCLATANSARKDGRHYARGCHHSRLPDKCWIVDPTLEHFVNIMVNLPWLGWQKNKQSIIMVRNTNFLTADDGKDLLGAMACITRHNKFLQLAKRKGAARSNAGDYGTMHGDWNSCVL